MADLAADQEALLRALVAHGVEFVVVGGVALQIYGWRGATADLDVAVSREDANVRRFNMALASVAAGPPAIGALGTVFQTRYGRLEVVARADGIGDYAAWLAGAAPRSVAAGLTVVLAAAEDVLRSKQAAGRDKDRAALPQIRRDLIEAGAITADRAGEPVAGPQASGTSAPPGFLSTLLGERPTDTANSRVWEAAAQLVLDYRARWKINDPASALGGHVPEGEEAVDREQLERRLRRSLRLLGARRT